MKYDQMERAVFLNRPNRFIANVRQGDREITCHVKNTGRCRELLIPGTEVYIQRASNPQRKTPFDLITVRKGAKLVNMDSQAPNKIVRELLEQEVLLPDVKSIRPETAWGESRFDFYVETETEKWFIEVKGVTLEVDGLAKFPDAPTDRGVRHLKELIQCRKEGYRAMVCFIIQMKGVYALTANGDTHPEFAHALKEAHEQGVKICAFDCLVQKDSLIADQEIPVLFDETDKKESGKGVGDND